MPDYHESQREKLVKLMHDAGYDPSSAKDCQSVAKLIIVSRFTVQSWLLPATSSAARTVSDRALDHLSCRCKAKIARIKLKA